MNTQFVTFPDGDPQPAQALKQDAILLDAYSNTVVNVAKKVSPSVVQIKVRNQSSESTRDRRTSPQRR